MRASTNETAVTSRYCRRVGRVYPVLMHVRLGWPLFVLIGPAALRLLVGCGGGAQESARTPGNDEPQFAVMKGGKPTWPPVGPGCDAFVACCKDAATRIPEVELTCKIFAAAPDCTNGRKSVVEMFEHDESPIPATCH